MTEDSSGIRASRQENGFPGHVRRHPDVQDVQVSFVHKNKFLRQVFCTSLPGEWRKGPFLPRLEHDFARTSQKLCTSQACTIRSHERWRSCPDTGRIHFPAIQHQKDGGRPTAVPLGFGEKLCRPEGRQQSGSVPGNSEETD